MILSMKNNIIGIICAMNKEACGIIERMTEVTTEEISGVTFNKGKINGKDCVVAVCGIGKVFAAVSIIESATEGGSSDE